MKRKQYIDNLFKNFPWIRLLRDYASAEQHRTWIWGKYSRAEWAKEGYPKYKSQGAMCDPSGLSGKPWSWFSGNDFLTRQYASAKQHREWIYEKYTQLSWAKEGHPNYQALGAVQQPAVKFNKPFSWFSGNDRLSREMASAEQHKKWIENKYTQNTWRAEGYSKYKNRGAVFNVHQKFDKPFSWFSGNDRLSREIASAEQHKQWIKEKHSFVGWIKNGYAEHKDQGAVSNPHRTFNKPWYWFSGNNMHARHKASAAQHRKWIHGTYTFAAWRRDGYPKHRDQGAIIKPHEKYGKPWSWFTGKKKK